MTTWVGDPGTVPDRAEDTVDRGPMIALPMARAIVGVVFCGFAAVALLFVLESGKDAVEIALAVAALAGLLGLQYFFFSRPSTDIHSPAAYAALGAQACLAYVPLALFGQSWVSQPAFLAGSVLLVFPLVAAWPAFVAIVASTAIVQSIVGDVSLDIAYIAVNTATTGLFVYGLTRFARLVTALHEARDELATTAVALERLRFARDLHGLLGLSLSAIAPKGELALRLVRRNPGRAEQELSEILEISRRALADVRSIAWVYREFSLEDKTGTLASMLAASNVELRTDLDHGKLPPHMRAALAAVLREGVAYVLRHRKVERCEIVLGQRDGAVSVDIVIDGARPDGDDETFAAMVSRFDGTFDVDADDGRFRLHMALPVTARPADRPAGEPVPYLATWLAGGLVAAVFAGFAVQAVLRLLYLTTEFWEVTLSTGCLLAALAVQLGYFGRPEARLRPPVTYMMLGVQALLVYLPMLQFQWAWTGLPAFVAASALLVLRPAAGWSVFAVVVATVTWMQISSDPIPARDVGLNIAVTVDVALITFGLTWMLRTMRQLRAARQELAEVALAETRLRFARDLHDLLGLGLCAITLKCELAYRLILRDPDRARGELAAVLELSRNALADVRSVASGYHEMSLAEECRIAESLLTTAGLKVLMDTRYGNLAPQVSTVLATVLREGVTNVLRHSKGGCCEITIREHDRGVRLHIVNDGATEPDGDEGGWGSGIRNMSERVRALDGELTANYDGDGRFVLVAHIP